MPPAGFEPTASGLGILRSILLSYRGSRNINCLQLYVSPFVSICANLCLMLSDAKLEEHLNNAHIIKPSFKNKVEEYAAAVENTAAEVFLLTGFSMRIKAMYDQINYNQDLRDKAARGYRLSHRPPRVITPEEDERQRLYRNKRN